MVRINLISPPQLADQHLIAEYNEILMLFGHVRAHPAIRGMPLRYCLGKGHITFFKNKLVYLRDRHELIKKEMRKRGFKTEKKMILSSYPRSLRNSWKPASKDFIIIKNRITEKILKKPRYYRYYGEHKPKEFFLTLLKK